MLKMRRRRSAKYSCADGPAPAKLGGQGRWRRETEGLLGAGDGPGRTHLPRPSTGKGKAP